MKRLAVILLAAIFALSTTGVAMASTHHSKTANTQTSTLTKAKKAKSHKKSHKKISKKHKKSHKNVSTKISHKKTAAIQA